MAIYVVATAAAVLFTSVIALYIRRSTHLVNARAPPSCRPAKRYPHLDPIFGLDLLLITILKMLRSSHITAVASRHKKYGDTFSITNVGFTTMHTIDVENISTVWQTKWEDWPVAPARQASMEPFCGHGFITSDGAEWQRFRSMLDPAFADTNVLGLDSLPEAFDEMVDRLPAEGISVDLAPYFEELFLDMTGMFLLGERFQRTQKPRSEDMLMVAPQDFLRAFHAAGFWVAIRITFGWIGMNWPNPSFRENCRKMHRFVDHYVYTALKRASTTGHGAGEESAPGKAAPNLVSSLVRQSTNTYEIRSQILQIMLASQDVIATLLSNCVFLLSRNAEAWRKLRMEVRNLGTEPLSADSLEHLPHLQNIIKEALRLYPIFGQMGRTASRDTTLPRGGGSDGQSPVFVPAGCRLIASFYALHRQPAVYGHNVEAFDPDRWNSIKPGKWEYLPFLDGPRSCPGKQLAISQVSFSLARLAQRFGRIESRDKREWAGEWKLIVKNHHGCKVALYSD